MLRWLISVEKLWTPTLSFVLDYPQMQTKCSLNSASGYKMPIYRVLWMNIDYKAVHYIPQDCRCFYGVDLLVKRFHGPLPSLIMTAGHSSLPIEDGATLSFIYIRIPFWWESEVTAYGEKVILWRHLGWYHPKNLAFGCFYLKSIVKSKLLKAMPSSSQKYHLEFASFVTSVTSLPMTFTSP